MKRALKGVAVFAFVGVAPFIKAQAADCVSNSVNGSWNNRLMWAGPGCVNTVPRSTDTVTIQSGHNITLNVSSTVWSVTINGNGRLQADNNNRVLTVNPMSNRTAFTVTSSTSFLPANSTVILISSSNINVNVGTITFNNLAILPTTLADHTYTFGSGSVTCNGYMMVNPTKASVGAVVTQLNMGATIGVSSLTITATTNARSTFTTTSSNYNLSAGAIGVLANGTFLANGSEITLTGSSSPLFTMSGAFNAMTSTVTVTSAATVTLTSNNNIAFNHLQLIPSLAADIAYTFGTSPVRINGDFTLIPQKVTVGNATLTTNLGAGLSMTSAGTIVVGGTNNGYSNLNTSGSNFWITTGRVDIRNNGTLTLNASTVSVTGTVAPVFNNAGAFAQGASTVAFMGDGSINPVIAGSVTFHNLNFTPTISGNSVYNLGTGSTSANGFVSVNPNAGSALTLTVNMGADLKVAPSRTLTVTRTGSALSVLDTQNYALTAGNLNVAANGTLNANSSTITLNGTTANNILFTEAGTFAPGTSTVIMNPDVGVTMTASGMTFWNLLVNPTLTANRAWSVGATSITALNNITVDPGASGLALTMGAAVKAYGTILIGGASAGSASLNTGGFAVDTSNLYVGPVSTFTANASALTFFGNSGTLYNVLGTLNPGTAAMTVNADGDVTLLAGVTSLGSLNIVSTITASRVYEMGAVDVSIGGAFNILPHKETGGSGTLTVNMGGAITVAAANNTTIGGTGNAVSVLDAVNGSNYTLSSGRLIIQPAGTFYARASAPTFTATSGTLITNNGTFDPGFSQVMIGPNAAITVNSGGLTFYDLIFNTTMTTTGRIYTLGPERINIIHDLISSPSAGAARALTLNMGAPISVGGQTLLRRSGTATTTLTTNVNQPFETGTMNIDTGATFNATGSTVTITGTVGPLITRLGTFTAGTSTVTVTSVGDTTINSGTLTFNNFEINTPNHTQTAAAAITVSNNLLITAGTLDDGGTQIAGNAIGDLTMLPNTGLTLGSAGTATTFPTNFTNANILFSAGSTVTYNAGVTQAISGVPTYENVVLNAPSGAPRKTQAAAVTMNGSLTIGANNTYDVGLTNLALNIGGSFSNSGTFLARLGTVAFTGNGSGLTLTGNMVTPSTFSALSFTGNGQWTLGDPLVVVSTLTVSAGTLQGAVDVTVNGGVVGNGTNGTINFTGGTFEQRLAANRYFGTNAGAGNDWTFNDLKFTNSAATQRTVVLSPTGTGRIVVNGTLTIGDPADPNNTTLDAAISNRALEVPGNVYIRNRGALKASSTKILPVGGAWTNEGSYIANGTTVAFSGSGAQVVRAAGGSFATIVSSNISSSGLMFASSFTAVKLYVNTGALSGGATLYFAGKSTFSVSELSVNGTTLKPVVMLSTDTGTYWHLNNTSTNSVSNVFVRDSDASLGRTILDYPGGTSIAHTQNWAIGAAVPTGLQFDNVWYSSSTLAWNPNVPTPDFYMLQLSTNSNFGFPATSAVTSLTNATTAGLLINTTYHARINSTLGGAVSAWSTLVTTATLANTPAPAASTWTAVNFTSASVAWTRNSNPLSVTRYEVQLSTVASFDSGLALSTATTNLTTTFENISTGTVYYAQVRAVNHAGIPTSWLPLGSTTTLAPQTPSNFRYTAVSSSTVTSAWNATTPPGDTYTLRVSTDSNFNGTVISSTTRNLSATTNIPLSANTTYYGQVKSVNSGISSGWAVTVGTATLADFPATAVSTWSAVYYSSLTVSWTQNNNPLTITPYEVDLSTVAGFGSGDLLPLLTTNLQGTFVNLDASTIYYAQVRAINHNGIPSSYTALGSTRTLTPNTCNAQSSGNWDRAATWINCTGAGGLPSVTDVVTINAGVDVTLNVNATVGGVIFAAPGVNNSLTHLSTVTLTVNGTVVMNQPTVDSRTSSWNLNAGSATVSGLITMAGSNATASRVSQIVITSGQLNAYGGLTLTASDNATKIINMAGGAGRLNLRGNLTAPANSGTLTAGTAGSVFSYADDSHAQTVQYFGAGAYHNLYLNNTFSAGVSLGAAVTAANVTGNVVVQSGTFKNSGFGIAGNAGKIFQVDDGGVFEMSGTSVFPTGFSTFTFGATSRVRYLQTTTPLTVTSQTYGHLDLMPAGAAVQRFPTGIFQVQGDLSVGDGTNATTATANLNNSSVTVNGAVYINGNANLVASTATLLTVKGNWTNMGVFTHSNSTVTFAGTGTQYVTNAGRAFANVVSSNTSAGGLVFSSSFTAARFLLSTNDLTGSATVYFAANSTFTVTAFSVSGSAGRNVVMRSTDSPNRWNLLNTGGNAVSFADVRDSNATGVRIFDYPGGTDQGNNINWAFAVNTPSNFQFAVVGTTAITSGWNASSPIGDSYTFELSTASDFTGTLVSSDTGNLTATNPTSLTPNTTYFGHVKSIISGASSNWSAYETTPTLANLPASAVSTWTVVNLTSVTASWLANSNPSVTLYVAHISTGNTFDGDDDVVIATQGVSALFTNLTPATQYFLRVKAISHANLSTNWVLLGSTTTRTPTNCNANVLGTWNWTFGSPNWVNCTGPGGVPGATDIITINSGVNVVLNTDATVGGLVFAAPGTANSLTHLSTVTLTVNGAVTLNQPTTLNRVSAWNINQGTVTVDGLITFAGAINSANQISRITIIGGQLNANGGMTFVGGNTTAKQIVMSAGDGEINLKGALTMPGANGATLTAGTLGSIFNYMDDANAQTVAFFNGGAYNNLHLNNTSAAGVTLGAAISAVNVTGNTRVQSGTFKSGGFGIVGGAGDTFEVANAATFELVTNSSFPTTYTTFTMGPTSRVRYLQTYPLTISAQTYGHLDLMPAGAFTQTLPAGAVNVAGDLTIGNGSQLTTVTAASNNTTLTVNGRFTINNAATYAAHATNPLNVDGDWLNNGVFTHNNSTVAFRGGTVQYIQNRGKAFANVISSNSSSGGLVFSSSFSAAQFYLRTADLNAGATLYFAARSTFTVQSFMVSGTPTYPVVVLSTVTGTYAYLNNTSTHVVRYVYAQDSNASQGLRILDHPGGYDLGHNLNWAIGLNPPAPVQFVGSQATSLDLAWSASSPVGDTYTLEVSTNSNFSVPFTSLVTGVLTNTTSQLFINTTYYTHLKTTINGTDSAWNATASSATLAVDPLPAASSWTAVNFTSVTVTWTNSGNPLNITRYQVQLSTVGDFLSGNVASTNTTSLAVTFASLVPATTYYAQVRAVNHSGIPTNWLPLGSTVTLVTAAPTNFFFSAVATSAVTGTWTASAPAGDSYSFQASTDSNFTGVVFSSATQALSATTINPLIPNTTYYGRVNALVSGSSSPWTPTLTTATLANIPATAVSTWTAVFITSLTVTWQNNNNPLGTTLYNVRLSTDSGFAAGVTIINQTVNALSADFDQLDSGTTYFAEVRAINHYGIPTNYAQLGGTKTIVSAIPKNLAFTAASTNTLSASWTASTPAGDTYTLRVSTDSNFGGVIVSSTVAGLNATTAAQLIPNTTYYGQARATVAGVPYPWSAYVTTATLANIPSTAVSTWTAINVTSLTVTWQNNNNPLNETLYEVQMATTNNFSGPVINLSTTSLSTTFSSLNPFTTYYAQVRARNHYGIPSNWFTLGSTMTHIPNVPENFFFSAASTTSLTGTWTAPTPAGNSYRLQVSTASDFSGLVTSTITANLTATTTAPLLVNTTYYGRLNALVAGATSPWTASLTTATLANPPVTVVSTWTLVSLTSVTANWASNNNPANVTQYIAQISTASTFNGDDDIYISTVGVQATFNNLETATVYYGRVQAVNYSGIPSAWFALGSTNTATPTTCNANVTGNWSAASTWLSCTGPGGLPAVTDIVNIKSGVVVTLDVDATVGGVIFAAATTANNALTHSSSNTLTVNGNVTFTQPTTNSRNNAWNINSATATVSGLISFAGTDPTTSRVSKIVITSGQLNAFGGMSFAAAHLATKLIVMSGGAGRLNLKGNLTIPANSCTLTAGTLGSVVNFMDDSSAQTVRFFSSGGYDNLYLNNTSAGGVSPEAAITVSNVVGDVRVQSGTFKNGGFAINGNPGSTFEVSNGATFEVSGSTDFPSSFTTYTLGATSRVRFLQTLTPFTLPALTYGHLDLMPAGTATQNFPAGPVTIQGDLGIGNGTNAAVVSANANNTALNVLGQVTINKFAVFRGNASNRLIVEGNWTNGGTFTHNNGTVTFSGGSAQAVQNAGQDFGYVVSSNTSTGGVVFSSSFSATQLWVKTSDLSSGATLYFAGRSTATIATINVNGTAAKPVILKSTTTGAAWLLNNTSTHTMSFVKVQDSDASQSAAMRAFPGGVDLGNNTNWDFGPPAAINNLAATQGVFGNTVNLTWAAPGENGSSGTLINSTFTIQYSTDLAFGNSNSWNPSSNPFSYVYKVDLATTNVAAGSPQGATISGLTSGSTYYFRAWTRDRFGYFSPISNGTTNYATNLILGITLSTDTIQFGSLLPGTTNVIASSITVTNTGNTVARFQISIDSPTIWQPTSRGAVLDEFRLTGIFKTNQPVSGDFSFSNDVMTASTATATTATFAKDSDPDAEKGFNVAPGSSRALWFRIEMPRMSTTLSEQTIRLHATSSE